MLSDGVGGRVCFKIKLVTLFFVGHCFLPLSKDAQGVERKSTFCTLLKMMKNGLPLRDKAIKELVLL